MQLLDLVGLPAKRQALAFPGAPMVAQ